MPDPGTLASLASSRVVFLSLLASLLLLHSLCGRLPDRTLGHSSDHLLVSTSGGSSTRGESPHDTRYTRLESTGPFVFTRTQQLSSSPEIIRKGLVAERADLESDYKAVRINADLPVLHTGPEKTQVHIGARCHGRRGTFSRHCWPLTRRTSGR